MNATALMNRNDWRALHGMILFALFVMATFIPVCRVWPLLWFVPLANYATVVGAVPPLRATYWRWRFGRVSRFAILSTLVIAVCSCLVLLAFHHFMQPDVRAYASFLPVSKLGGVFATVVFFSVINALCEEVIFRGVFFDALESQWGARGAIVATAALFGYGHLHGYPPGPLGAVLAGVYGLCLGWLRIVTAGIGFGVIAHVVADATICVIVVRSGVL